MKKQELISIEEQMYAKGIWKRPKVREWNIELFCPVSFNGKNLGKHKIHISGDLIGNMEAYNG